MQTHFVSIKAVYLDPLVLWFGDVDLDEFEHGSVFVRLEDKVMTVVLDEVVFGIQLVEQRNRLDSARDLVVHCSQVVVIQLNCLCVVSRAYVSKRGYHVVWVASARNIDDQVTAIVSYLTAPESNIFG